MMMARKQRDNGLFFLDSEGSRRQIRGSSSSCSLASTKRLKTASNVSPSETISTRDRRDKIGEKVAALQKLVSPFGKTDTASVLQEATDYIRFLHEQVQVLSTPYLRSPVMQISQGSSGQCNSLRSRGLCLVPLSQTSSLASNNGADIWASNNTSPRF